MKQKSKRGQRLLASAAVLVVLVLVVVFVLSGMQDRALTERTLAAKAVGFPLTGQDLVPSIAFQPHENAASVYEKAISTLRATVFTDRTAGESAVFELHRRELTAMEHAALSTYLAEASPAIAEFKSATAMPYCYFEKDWDRGMAVTFPEYGKAKTLVSALTAGAWLKARGGKLGEAEDDLLCALRAAAHFQVQPTMIATLLSIALDGMVSSALHHLLSEDEAALAMVERVAQAMPEQWDLTLTLRSEAFCMFWMTRDDIDLRRSIGLKPADGFVPEIDMLQKSAYMRRSVRITVLGAYTQLLREYKPTGDERAVLDAFDAFTTSISRDKTPSGIVFSAFGPRFRNLTVSLDRARSRKAHLLAAVRILEHRSKTSAWPTTLSEAGAKFEDPYDGSPLRFRLDGAGFRVWSVGEDGHSNGGLTREEAKGAPFDEVLVYPRLP
ncbi:MAG: hypothetical protein WD716_06405 [Fimbriimonadaceae bacterium]